MAEVFSRGVSRILTTPFSGLLATSSIRRPYLELHGRCLLRNWTPVRHKTYGGPLNLGSSSQKGKKNGGLCVALQVEKSTKKLKSKRKNLNTNDIISKHQENVTFYPALKASNPKGSKASSSRAAPVSSNEKAKTKSSFLSACQKSLKSSGDSVNTSIAGIDSKFEKGLMGNKVNSYFGQGTAASFLQRAYEDGGAVQASDSSGDVIKTMKNYKGLQDVDDVAVAGKDYNYNHTLGLDRREREWLDLDLSGSVKWVPEYDHVIHRDLAGRDLQDDVSAVGYEHLLYNEKRHRSKINGGTDSGGGCGGGCNDGKGGAKLEKSTLCEPGVLTKNSTNHQKDAGIAAQSPNGFILVKEGRNTAPQSSVVDGESVRKTKAFNNEVDSLIQTLQNNSWEKAVQKRIDAKNKSRKHKSNSFVIVNDKPCGRDKSALNLRQFCDENALVHPKDQRENYIFGGKSYQKHLQNVSTVPQNTSQMASQVFVEQLKPDSKRKQPSLLGEHEARKSPTIEHDLRSNPEPVLMIQPSEIINRKKQQQHQPVEIAQSKSAQSRHLVEVSNPQKEIRSSFSTKDKRKKRKHNKASNKDALSVSSERKGDDYKQFEKGMSQNETLEALGRKNQLTKDTFREDFLQMQRNRLLKMGLAPHIPQVQSSSLVHTPNSQAKWLAVTLNKANKNKITETNKHGVQESLPHPVSSPTKGNYITIQKPISAASEDRFDQWTEKNDGSELVRNKSKKHGTSVSTNDSNKERKKQSQRDEQLYHYEDELQHSQPGYGEGKGLFPVLSGLDGLMTMTLTPVHDDATTTPQKGSKNQGTQSESTMSKNHQKFQEIQLQRNMEAMRRYQERQQVEKGEKKKKKNKRTKKRNNSNKGRSPSINYDSNGEPPSKSSS